MLLKPCFSKKLWSLQPRRIFVEPVGLASSSYLDHVADAESSIGANNKHGTTGEDLSDRARIKAIYQTYKPQAPN